jgi:DNA-binding NarL/FixJ family response regulator
MPLRLRILIADDHPIFRHGLRQLIEKESHIRVVAEVDNGESALESIAAHRPDIAILDVDMPRKDGFAVARELLDLHSPTRVIFLTLYKDAMHLDEGLRLGIKGYVIKDSAATDITRCIEAVAAGNTFVSVALSVYLQNRGKGTKVVLPASDGLRGLTATERHILFLLAGYKTNREIAVRLFVSVRTVENHRANICAKLSLHGTHALMKYALKHLSELTPDERQG